MVQTELQNLGFKRDKIKLKVVNGLEWYAPDGEFDSQRVVDQYRTLIDDALETGYSGLYVSADASNIFDYLSKKGIVNEWLDYEQNLGKIFKFPMQAICAYRTDQLKLNKQIFIQLVKAHKETVSNKTGERTLNDLIIRRTIFQKFKKILGIKKTSLLFDYFYIEQAPDINHVQNISPKEKSCYGLLNSFLKEGYSPKLSLNDLEIFNQICDDLIQTILFD